MTEPSAADEPQKSGRRFLGASRPPKPPSEMTEPELDTYVRGIVREIAGQIEQAKAEDATGQDP